MADRIRATKIEILRVAGLQGEWSDEFCVVAPTEAAVWQDAAKQLRQWACATDSDGEHIRFRVTFADGECYAGEMHLGADDAENAAVLIPDRIRRLVEYAAGEAVAGDGGTDEPGTAARRWLRTYSLPSA